MKPLFEPLMPKAHRALGDALMRDPPGHQVSAVKTSSEPPPAGDQVAPVRCRAAYWARQRVRDQRRQRDAQG